MMAAGVTILLPQLGGCANKPVVQPPVIQVETVVERQQLPDTLRRHCEDWKTIRESAEEAHVTKPLYEHLENSWMSNKERYRRCAETVEEILLLTDPANVPDKP